MTVYSTALTGLAAAHRLLERVADKVSRTAVSGPGEADAVVLSEEMMKLLAVRRAAQTAVKLVQAANEVEKSALNLMA